MPSNNRPTPLDLVPNFDADSGPVEVPHPPSELVHLDETAVRVLDADDEIFDLYSNLSSSPKSPSTALPPPTGLGFLSTQMSLIELDLEIRPPAPSISSPLSPSFSSAELSSSGSGRKGRTSGSGKRERGKMQAKEKGKEREKIVSVKIHQDLGALRNRKGDTGSVIWRASLYLAEHLLQQYHFPSPSLPPLLSPTLSPTSRTLELGSGTGLLSILLHPLFSSFTVSDQYDNLKLISRNLRENEVKGKVGIEEVDWMSLGRERKKEDGAGNGNGEGEYDLVLGVDCIYNEALVKPFVNAIERYTTRDRTIAWIVAELRSSDVMLLFVEEWLSRSDWQIWRLGENAMGEKMARNFVGWIGWRSSKGE